jgi:uncharacterized protein YuzE
MRIEYDPEADAAYITLVEKGSGSRVAQTVPVDPAEVNGEINLDFEESGRLIGIEVLDASRLLPPEALSDQRK